MLVYYFRALLNFSLAHPFSNIAIDNIASGLMRLGWNVLRAGRGATALTSITISERIKGDARYGEVLSARHNRNFNSAREMEMKISLDLVRKADVVLATCIRPAIVRMPGTNIASPTASVT